MKLWVVWLIVIILLAIIEVMSLNLVTVWFMGSAFVSLILAIFIPDLINQICVFILGGFLLMILTKPIIIELNKNKKAKLELKEIVGKEGLVTKEITKSNFGEVNVNDKLWMAKSGKKISVNTLIKVKEVINDEILVVERKPKKGK